MRRLLRDRYIDNSLERAMFERGWRRAESSFPVGSVLFFGLLVLAVFAHFAD
jgi:hypothetical protein